MTERTPGTADFQAAYHAHYDAMVRLAYLITGGMLVAEDVVQDAFVDLYRRWPEVLEPGAWLRRAVANRSISWVRRRKVARRHEDRHRPEPIQPPPTAEHTVVRDALAKLKPRQRAAVFMRSYLDLSESDTAAALGCRPGTVKSLVHRALVVLKGELDAD